MNVTLEHYTSFVLPKRTSGSIVFPGAAKADPTLHLGTNQPQSLGYVRSPDLIQQSWKYRHQQWEASDEWDGTSPQLPFRDYVGLRIDVLDAAKNRPDVLCVSARNVCNEPYYRARIDGTMFRTARDPGLPAEWPVLCASRDESRCLRVKTLGGVSDADDFVSGVALVIQGSPSSRGFLLAHSEVAHTYRTDPHDRFGTPGSWLPLSRKWNELHTKRLEGMPIEDEAFEKALDDVARDLGLSPPNDPSVLSHSIVAEQPDGTLWFLVLSTSLPIAAQHLAAQGFVNAFLLDQSGSIGVYLNDSQGHSRMLVSNPNFRPQGTCYILIDTGFVGVHQHAATV